MSRALDAFLMVSYEYEDWLSALINRRNEWGERKGLMFCIDAEAIYRAWCSEGKIVDRNEHLVPSDPLTLIPDPNYCFLLLKRPKLNLLCLEVYKCYRRGDNGEGYESKVRKRQHKQRIDAQMQRFNEMAQRENERWAEWWDSVTVRGKE